MYTRNEKLAIIKALVEVVGADGKYATGEHAYMMQLSEVLGFEPNDINEAMKQEMADCIVSLSTMSDEKKAGLVVMMHEMAKADGTIDKSEMDVISGVFLAAGIKL